ASFDGTAQVWDAESWPPVSPRLEGHTAQIACIAFSPDGQWLATADWNGAVKLWNARTGEKIRDLEGHGQLVADVAFSPDGRLATASHDRTVRIWDPATGQALL